MNAPKLIAILVLVMLRANIYPQLNDSVQKLLESVPDTAKIRILKDLCWENRYRNPADALKFGLESLSLMNESGKVEFEATIHNYLGIIQRNIGDNASALEYFYQAKQIAAEQANATDMAYSQNNIGDIYNLEGNYLQALEFETAALTIFEELGDSLGVSYCCHQIALVYTNMGEYQEALAYDKRAMKIREFLGNRAGVAYSLISIGQDYLKLGDNVKSLESLNASTGIFNEIKDRYGLTTSLYNIGIYHKMTGNVEEAVEYLNRALEMGVETGSPIQVRNAAQELTEVYAAQARYKEAYEMHILYKETYDSLHHEENLVRITQLVMQNEYEQRELLQLAEIERQKQVRNYLILSFALVVILVVVIFNRYYIKRKANIKLQQKNREIQSQSEELERLFVSVRIKNDELSEQNEEISAQKDHLAHLNEELEKQKSDLNNTLRELTQTQIQLVQSEKMASLGQVTAGVAHELNNPLNFISSSISPLQRNVEELVTLLGQYEALVEGKGIKFGTNQISGFKDAIDYKSVLKETKDLLKGIKEGSTRSEQIVKGLRTFSRLDENEFKKVDIHEGIESTLLLLRNKIRDKITIHKKFRNKQRVECLPGKLNQVFMNILTNSILAIEDGGDIFIETSNEDDKVRISIRDNGSGMSPDVKAHIFEPFFTTRAVGKGTGLGLSISYSIVKEHNGTIEVISEPGAGSEFIITIPVVNTA